MKKLFTTTKAFLCCLVICIAGLSSTNVNAQTCQAGFGYNAGPNGVVYFSNASTSQDTILSYYWSFGNNQYSTVANPFTTYLNSGVYTTCLIIQTATCIDTVCQQITVNLNGCNLTAGILSDSLAGIMIATVNGGTQPFTYEWSNGSTQQLITPTTTGNYCVTVYDALGCSSTACYYWSGLYCNIGYTYTSPSAGLYNFYASGTNGQQATWTFGDGSNPLVTSATYVQHSYTQSGTYYVCISMPNCQPYCNYINVNIPLPCAGVSTNILPLQNNTYVMAEVFNANFPVSYQWTSGDTGQAILTNGDTSFCVTITDALGCTATDCITITPGCSLTAIIDTFANPGALSAIVYNGVGPYTYAWNDGSTQSLIYPTQPGQYCVTITDALGCSTTACGYSNGNLNCNYGFSFNTPVQGAATFYAYGTAGQGVTWNFGDGSNTVFNYFAQASHTFLASGVYNVCMTVGNCPAFCMPVTINITNPNCNLAVFIDTDSIAGTLTAYATNGTQPYAYSWTNGSNQQVIAPTQQGNYCVTVTDTSGCSATDCVYWYGNNCNYGFTYVNSGQGNITFITYGTNNMDITWNFGDGSAPVTGTSTQVAHTYLTGGYYTVCITIPGCNSYCLGINVVIPGSSVLCGTIFNDNNNNSVIDGGDTGVDSVYLYLWGGNISQTATTDTQGNYSFGNLPAGTYNVQFCIWNLINYQGVVITVPADTGSCGYYTVTVGANDTVCGNNFGIYNNASQISGTVFFDTNNNGVMDGNESGLPYQSIQIGNTYIYSDWNGNYSAWMLPGNYTITFNPSANYAAWNITTPTSYQVNVTGPGNVYAGNNFGLYMPPGLNDLSIVITPHTTVTPGFPAWYDINVCNNGTSATGATVTMIYDNALTPNYQTPAGTVNAPTHTITWTIANINPGACTNIWTNFNASTGIQLGSSTLEFVMVSSTNGTDINLTNNTDTVHQTVVGSWDPNNKLVVKTNNPADAATQFISSVNADQEIMYTVNFQNTGNAPAVNVVVIDEMANELDLNSYEFISASHTCDVSRIGNTVTYRFMNIMLPDSTNDEPNSHGYINFKVNATNGLAMGTQIIDFANIYFDFNAPVLTNNAVVTMVDVTGIYAVTNSSALIYPNPAKENFTLAFAAKESGMAGLIMYDNTGKKVLNTQTAINAGQNKTSIATSAFENGIYFIELIQPDGTVLKNVVSIQK